MVGNQGRVIAIDVQQKMLNAVERRVRKTGYPDRLSLMLAKSDKLGIEEPFDFALAFWMYHEVPNQRRFMSELFNSVRDGKRVLVAEPKMHVKEKPFQKSMDVALAVGFSMVNSPSIWLSRTALLEKITQ